MKITNITIKYGQTYNLGNYSNVRPEIILSAEVEEGELAEDVIVSLKNEARAHTEVMIDEALEADDEPPYYYSGPRFTLYTQEQDKLVAIAPAGIDMFKDWYPECRNRRFEVIQEKFNFSGYVNWQKFDCTKGGLSRLPILESFIKITNNPYDREETVYALIMLTDKAPDGWRSSYHYGGLSDRIRENVIAEVEAQAKKEGKKYIDATDGDLSKLPPAVGPLDPERGYDDDDQE